jgi:predicted permease
VEGTVLAQLLNVVAPVFAVAFVGWAYAAWRRVDLRGLADVVLYLSAPALVFGGLVGADTRLGLRGLLLVGGGAVFASLCSGAAAWAVFRATRFGGRGLVISAMFPNTGNLGLPLALFAFGEEGLAVAVVVFVSITLVHYSLGVMIVSGSTHPGPALRMPLFHAAVVGVALTLAGIELPAPLLRGVNLLGQAAVPLMLLSLGIRMRSVRLTRPWPAMATVALRMLPGFAASVVWVAAFGLAGAERGVVLVTGVLPPAVMNFVLAEAHGQQGEEVASAILLGTTLSVLVIPAVLAFAA